MKEIYEPNGKLKEEYLPAIYFDTSFLIEYWIAEQLESPNPRQELGLPQYDLPYEPFLRELLKADVKMSKVGEIRRKILTEEVKLTPITSPLATIEMIEWKAEASLKQIIADKISALTIQKRSKKDIGDYLKKILEARKQEMQQINNNSLPTPPMEALIIDTSMNSSYYASHALHGIALLDLRNFNITMVDAWQTLWPYAYLQLGLADCLHIFAAHHLGCTYFGSLDSDFRRVKDIVEQELEITVLTSPEEILAVF